MSWIIYWSIALIFALVAYVVARLFLDEDDFWVMIAPVLGLGWPIALPVGIVGGVAFAVYRLITLLGDRLVDAIEKRHDLLDDKRGLHSSFKHYCTCHGYLDAVNNRWVIYGQKVCPVHGKGNGPAERECSCNGMYKSFRCPVHGGVDG